MQLEEYLEKIIELDYLSIHVSHSLSLVFVIWKRQPNQEEIRTGFTLITGQMIAYNCRLWLADFRKVLIMDEENQHWYVEQLLPELRFTQIKKVARVVSLHSSCYYTAINLAELANKCPLLKGRTEHRVFIEMEQALGWLGI